MKLGIEREKIGDILVFNDGAYIIACKDIIESLANLLSSLTRFSKSDIQIIETQDIPQFEIKKEEIKIIIPSLRLDSIVSELVHTSRSKALDLLKSEKIFINYEVETKPSKLLKIHDTITIRGKGKFDLINICGNTKSGNIILLVNKYI